MRGAKTKTSKVEPFKFRQSSALLHNVLESGSVGTVLVGMDGRVVYANRAFSDILGYRPETAVGLEVKDLVYPDFRAEAAAQMTDLINGEIDGYRAERRFVKKNGETMWLLVSGSLLRNERTGRPLYLIAQLTDIDKQKRAEQALAESEQRWNSALEAAGQGVWDHDIRTDKMYYSRMWRVMRGFAPDEEVDGALDQWLKRVHPDDRERILAIVLRQDTGEIAFNAFEYRERHRDGHYIWILSRGRPVEWFSDGQPARIVGTDTDITSLKAVEAQLAEEKERLRVTLESIGDGVISTDAEGRVLFMNPVAEQMTGWQSWEAVGQRVEDVFDIVDEATGDAAANPVVECLARRAAFQLDQDVLLVSRSSQKRAVRDSAAPVRTPQGELLGAVLVFQDITHARALQKELAHSAMHDGLTGLPNRVAFERALTAACEQARRELREHVLCFVDLDRFKAVNDSAGHSAGDALLKEIGQVIRRGCRAQDFAARIGGDEFALLLADCSTTAARRVAQQIIDAIIATRFSWDGMAYQIGASVGIAPITHSHASVAELMSQADSACYAAKASGRNSVSVYDGAQHGPQRFKQSA